MPKQMGRLAMRIEGDDWAAYYALPDTMEGAFRLGSVKMAIVRDLERRQMFMDLMRHFIGDILAGKFGEEPTWKTEPAPEHERSGRA